MNVLRFLSLATSDTPQPDAHGRRSGRPLTAPTATESPRARATGGVVYGPHARRNPTDGPPGEPTDRRGAGRPPSPEIVTRGGFAALVRAWMRALTPDAWAPVHDTPHPLTIQVMRWAPIVAPAVIGSLLLTLTLALRTHERALYAPLPANLVVPALLAVYLLGGALLGLALYFAPNGVVWNLALFGAPALLLCIMFAVAFGAPGALLALSLLAALLLIYSCWRQFVTRPGSVEVTLLLGEWYRTLQPGYNILLPGERVITTLRTTPRAFTTATQRVALTPHRVAQARATVAYLVNPHEAWRTASVRATWEDELRQRISSSVRDCLDDWRYTPSGDTASRGSVARRILDENRDWARSVGVRILSIRAHDIAIGSPDELAPQQPADTSGQRATPRVEGAPATPRVMATGPSTPAGAAAPAPDDVPDDETWTLTSRVRTAQVVVAPAHPVERPSAEALEDLYEAVRNRQITDTQVIREIASHFTALASEPHAPGELPFDPAAAARLLNDYAHALDAARPAVRTRTGRPRRY